MRCWRDAECEENLVLVRKRTYPTEGPDSIVNVKTK
jgi:hypothetical protein